jgi:CysZ protein
MNFFKDLFKAIANCFKGFNLIFQKGLWPYIFYPLIVWLVMWIASIWLFTHLAETIANYFTDKLNFQDIPDKGGWLSFAKPFLTGYGNDIMTWIFRLLFWLVSGTFSKYMTLIFLSPLFAMLSEATEEKITGKKYEFNTAQFIKDVLRGIAISLRNMLFEYFFMALCFLITLFFPPLFFIVTPLMFLISWYFTGFTMFDYNFERHQMNISQSVKFIRKHTGLAIGVGMIYSLFMLLPLFLGLMFGPVLAVIGSCISFLELKQTSTENENTL